MVDGIDLLLFRDPGGGVHVALVGRCRVALHIVKVAVHLLHPVGEGFIDRIIFDRSVTSW